MSKLDEAVNTYLDSRGINWKKGRMDPVPTRWKRIGGWFKEMLSKPIKHVKKGILEEKRLKGLFGIERDFYSIVYGHWNMPSEEVAVKLQKDKGYGEEEAVNYVNKMMEIE